jgi:hypothetical protein
MRWKAVRSLCSPQREQRLEATASRCERVHSAASSGSTHSGKAARISGERREAWLEAGFFTICQCPSRETGGCHIAFPSKNRPPVLDDWMALLTQREQVVEGRETAFASGKDVVDMQRGCAHGRPAALACVAVTMKGRRSSS